MVTPITYEPVYRIDQVARIFKLTPRAVRTLIRNGDLPAIRLGRYYRIPKSAIDDLFASAVKTDWSPEDLGFGIWKARIRDSVSYVNRLRARNKKSLKQTVAELSQWRFD
jgi:excisionase family DNA binding protein